MSNNTRQSEEPVSEKQRFLILDALRGFALLGIALANFPEFALWTFLSNTEQQEMATGGIDEVVRFFHYMLIDGKFYTIFSLLFGVGFGLFLSRHSVSRFLRRMLILALIGACHLMFIWSGDILLLYAVGGMLLPLFIRLKDKALLIIALFLILLPVGLDALTEFAGIDFAGPFYDAWWREAHAQGITAVNFATWLRDAHSYSQMFAFLLQGAFERMWEFVSGHRLPRVVGFFLIGYFAGRHKVYADLKSYFTERYLDISLWFSIPWSILYGLSATGILSLGLTVHSALYTISILSMSSTYIIGFCVAYQHTPSNYIFFPRMAAMGRMALSNYIGQSLIGIILFYGLGFGLGASLGLVFIILITLVVFLLQTFLSALWLKHFQFGPLEWLWRVLTYGHALPIRRITPIILLMALLLTSCGQKQRQGLYYGNYGYGYGDHETVDSVVEQKPIQKPKKALDDNYSPVPSSYESESNEEEIPGEFGDNHGLIDDEGYLQGPDIGYDE